MKTAKQTPVCDELAWLILERKDLYPAVDKQRAGDDEDNDIILRGLNYKFL